MKKTHLKSIKNGRVFLFSKILADRNDMIPCNADGQIAEGHIGDAAAADAGINRRVTKFLGNVKNGVLYRYTEFLAERDDMVSIDSEAQWKAMQSTGEAPEQSPEAIAPSLKRTANAPSIEPTIDLSKEPIINADGATAKFDTAVLKPGTELPDITGLGAREAKTLLSEWAEKEFKVKLDRRLALDEFVKECQLLAPQQMDKAAGQ